MGWQLGLVNQDIWNYSCLILPHAAAGPWQLSSGWMDWDDLPHKFGRLKASVPWLLCTCPLQKASLNSFNWLSWTSKCAGIKQASTCKLFAASPWMPFVHILLAKTRHLCKLRFQRMEKRTLVTGRTCEELLTSFPLHPITSSTLLLRGKGRDSLFLTCRVA